VIHVNGNICGSDSNGSTLRHRLIRIDDDILDNLVDLADIYFYRPQIGRQIEIAPGLGPAQCKCGTTNDDIRDGCDLLYRCAALTVMKI
jgi:hypothetical protein